MTSNATNVESLSSTDGIAEDGQSLLDPPSDGGNRPRSTTGDLLKVMESLAAFERIGVTPLARELNLPIATIYRMLRVLQRAGYVEQLETSKEYRLTLKLFEIGCQVASRTTIRDIAAVDIERMAQETGLTTNLGVLTGRDVLYLFRKETDELLALNLPTGSRAPATCTAMGKAMLAYDPRPTVDILGTGPYPACTDNSIRTNDALDAELTLIRELGYAVDRQELHSGVWCVAAPILDQSQIPQGAISVTTYRSVMDEAEFVRLGQVVMNYAGQITARIGKLAGTQFR